MLHVRLRPGHVRVHSSEEDGSAHVFAWNNLCDTLDPWSQRYPDVHADVRVVRGNPTRALLAAAAEARLVVLGSRGRGAPARALFGSTSREVLRLCPVPVVVVSPAAGDRDERPVAVAAGPLLREPLQPGQVKPRLLGHWGTTPGLNLLYATCRGSSPPVAGRSST